MLLDDLRVFVRAHVPEHLRGLWTPDGETQLNFDDARIRIPHDGNGSPDFHDTAYAPPLSSLVGLGVSGWNYVDGLTLFVTIDLDALDHAAGHDQRTLDDLIRALCLLPQVEIIRSKGGKGYHVRVYFDPDNAPRSRTRDEHIALAMRVLAWLANRTQTDLVAKSDACGVIAWIYHVERAPNGLTQIKQSTAFMPEGWDTELPHDVRTGDCEFPDHPAISLTPKHQRVLDALTQRGMGEWKDGRLTTHTYNLAVLAQEKPLGIVGGFATIASGKDCPADRNCFAYPDANGAWRVYRFGKNTQEHETWWKSTNGHTTTWFNRGREAKADVPSTIVASANQDELFHDLTDRAYVTTTIRGVKETLPISDGRYRAKLRLAYTGQTGRIASADNISTACAQLEATALLDRPEYPVAIRIAEHGGSLFVDLADRERRIIRVSADGWRLIDDSPVRFIRPFGLLPLPVPQPGGTLAELRPFLNVEDEDLPLLLAFVVGCFHPAGPYSLLQIVGEQGSAKSSLMRFVHDLVDPQIAVGNTLPRDERDMLVAAQQRWLLSFDNVDSLSRKLSSLLCMLITGAASANRKLFTDADQSILRAKRPIVVTAIANVVTASDLLDRTLTLMLPPIAPEQRKSEFAIAQELRRDGVRGRIFGYILDGVASALAGHAGIHRDDMPRLADLFSWATAAEHGLCLPNGSTIEAFKRQAAEESQHTTDSEFGTEIIKLCGTGWRGTARQLSQKLSGGLSPRDTSNHLREIAPDLRRNGHIVRFVRVGGARVIDLSTAA